MMWQAARELQLAGNEAWRWVAFFGAILLSLVAGKLAQTFVGRFGKRFEGGAQAWKAVLFRSLARAATPIAFAVGLWLAILSLTLTPKIAAIAHTVARVLTAASVGYGVYCLVDLVDYVLSKGADRTESKVDDMLAPLVGRSVRITIVAVVVLQVAQALSDKPIPAIVASLGVGGVAVALAAQDTIKNFFGSLVIIADKPFEIGDRVVINGHDGPIESVGFRSTRIRTLDGHLVTIPNSELANMTVQNVGKRPYIRRVANITITYDTPPEKVQRGVEILTDILADHEGMHPDFPPRVFFSDFNDCSLNIVMIYWYHPPDYWSYMAFTQRVNDEILRRFNDEGIEFAFPTRTLYLANDDRRQLALRMLPENG